MTHTTLLARLDEVNAAEDAAHGEDELSHRRRVEPEARVKTELFALAPA